MQACKAMRGDARRRRGQGAQTFIIRLIVGLARHGSLSGLDSSFLGAAKAGVVGTCRRADG